jgi:PTEN induced putative kinase 1
MAFTSHTHQKKSIKVSEEIHNSNSCAKPFIFGPLTGGNTALMAPEIIGKTAGLFSILNYTKSDLWATGTISYEIFNKYNPFYGKLHDTADENLDTKPLKSIDYNESDLPMLESDVPYVIQKLIENILQRNPNKVS